MPDLLGPQTSSLQSEYGPNIKVASLQPEYGTIKTATFLFGLSRSEIFDLIKAQKIESIHYKKKAEAERGIRLIKLDSVREYLHSLLPVKEAK
jgi:hypothetical protein